MMLIKDEQVKKILLESLSDEYSRSILDATIYRAKSVPEIMRERNIPMTSSYRRVKKLIDAGLLKVEKSEITDEGVKYETYKSNVRSISVKFEGGSLEVTVTPNFGATEKLSGLYFSMKGGD